MRAAGSVAAGLSEGVCLVLLVVIPAFFNLSVERICEEEKALFLRAAAVLLLGLMVAGAVSGRGSNGACAMGRSRETWRHPIAAAFALFAGSLVLASFTSLAPYESWLGAYYRRHGVATWGALLLAFLAMAAVARSTSSRERLLHALVVGSLWPSVYAVCQALGWGSCTHGRLSAPRICDELRPRDRLDDVVRGHRQEGVGEHEHGGRTLAFPQRDDLGGQTADHTVGAVAGSVRFMRDPVAAQCPTRLFV